MPTLVITIARAPDGLFLARCPSYALWKPAAVDVVDKPALEKSLKGHQSRATRFVYEGWDGRVLDDAPAGKGH